MRDGPFTLAEADENGQVVSIVCKWCRVTRHYLPTDLVKLLGAGAVLDDVRGRFRCERCGKADHLRAWISLPSAAERQAMRFRRLKGVRVSRRPVWVDDTE
jgi:hypothetical protein